MNNRRQRTVVFLLGGVVPLGLLLLTVTVPAAFWSRLPEPVADHWRSLGAPNGSHPKLVAFGIAVVVTAVGAGLLAFWARRSLAGAGQPTARRSSQVSASARTLAAGLILAGLGAVVSLDLTLANLDVRHWQDARLGVPRLILTVAGPWALAAAGTLLARRVRLGTMARAADGEGPARLGLAATERAFWLSGARSSRALPLAVVGLCGAVALGLTEGWEPALAVLAVSVAILCLSSVSVSASAAGVAVRYGPLHWPVTRIALRRIVSAEAIELSPRSWGYRGSLHIVGAAAVIVRKGAALHLDLKGDKSFLVTVDGAATGAALINDELARRPGPVS